ncbi:MAG TPA: hypothetical protein VHB51_03065 [Candidatus Saccharimonadales bacterium]|nr:hypothetical protein [Candidatus Saccharimonadales bacterium]
MSDPERIGDKEYAPYPFPIDELVRFRLLSGDQTVATIKYDLRAQGIKPEDTIKTLKTMYEEKVLKVDKKTGGVEFASPAPFN